VPRAVARRCYRHTVAIRSNRPHRSEATVAIDGCKFKAVNNRDKNFTERKLQARMQQLDKSVPRYLMELDRADRDTSLVTEARVSRRSRPRRARLHAGPGSPPEPA